MELAEYLGRIRRILCIMNDTSTWVLEIGDVVGHDDAVSALVVAASNGLEALLASGVPNLELNGLSVDIDGPDFLQTRLAREGGTYEVDSDCGHEVVCEHVVGESEKQGGLSDSGVSNQQHPIGENALDAVEYVYHS